MRISNTYELLGLMNDALFEDGEESVHYVADSERIRDLMRCVCESENYVPDMITFDTEACNYYYLSLDRDEDDSISFSIYEACNDDGYFFGMLGLIFVDEDIPDDFENDISKLNHITEKPIRVSIGCDGDCEHCDCATFEDDEFEDDMHGYSRSWTDEYGTHKETFYSTDPELVKFMLMN